MDPFIRSPRRILFGALTVLVGFAAGCASTPSQAPPSEAEAATPSLDAEPIDRTLALATFDSAWSRINSSYYDPEFRGLDWGGVRDELRPAASSLETRGELRTLLRDMLSRLGESHFALFPQESVDRIAIDDESEGEGGAGEGDIGLEVRWVEGQLTVFRIDQGAAYDAGVRPGWILEAIGTREMAAWAEVIAEAESESARVALETQTVSGAASLFGGSVGSSLTLRVRDGRDASRTLDLDRRPVRGQMVQFGQLPAMAAHLDFERIPTESGCVGLIEFNIWMIPLVAPFNRAVDAVADCDGIVIDLRGNRGGVGGMVMSTAGSFFADRADLGIVKSRAGELRFVAMPRGVDTEGRLRDAFEGRLAVLIDQLSMSTSEIFAAGLKASGRARLFGTTTPGYALPAMTIRLPSQDVLYHVVSDLTDPEGRRIEGQGVQPDVAIPLDRADLLAGRDAALEAAVGWAGGEGSGSPSGRRY
jgi:carboxyl-terminal processing protease